MRSPLHNLIPLLGATLALTACTVEEPLLRAEPYSTSKSFFDNWQRVDAMVKSGTTNLPDAEASFRKLYGGRLTTLRSYPFDNECIIHDPPTELILLHIRTKQQFESFLRHLISDNDFIDQALTHFKGPILALGSDASSWVLLFFDRNGMLIEAFGRAAPDEARPR